MKFKKTKFYFYNLLKNEKNDLNILLAIFSFLWESILKFIKGLEVVIWFGILVSIIPIILFKLLIFNPIQIVYFATIKWYILKSKQDRKDTLKRLSDNEEYRKKYFKERK